MYMIHEFTAKKLGEVVAFSRIGCELAERGGDAFVAALGTAAGSFQTELQALEAAAIERGSEVTAAKAEKTTVKLRAMMEQYIGDEWDNPVEILEWLSFFTGAGSAHWALLGGVADETGDADLRELAKTGQQQYHQYLHTTIESLQTAGKDRVTAA